MDEIGNDRRHTAVHEAGHAVIGRAVAMVCGSASIVADEDSAGHSMTEDPYSVQHQWELRERFRGIGSVVRGRIITYMAGAEAEVELLGECEGGDIDDRRQITFMFYDSADEDDHARLEGRLRRFTRQLVRRHRADVERVAAALEERGTLTGEEIDAMLPTGFMARPVS